MYVHYPLPFYNLRLRCLNRHQKCKKNGSPILFTTITSILIIIVLNDSFIMNFFFHRIFHSFNVYVQRESQKN